MNRVLRALAALFKANCATMLQYRGEIFLWAVWGLVNPAVLYAMWSAAADSRPGGTVAGFTQGQLAAYYFMVMLLGHFATAWDAYDMGFQVRSGRMSALLLRPILPIWQAIAANLSYKVTTLPFLVPMWAFFAWWVRPEFDHQAWHYALGAVAVLLGCALNFMLGYLIALIAFWSPKLDAAGEIYFGLGMFLGGRFAPLAALPPLIFAFAAWLPFRWMFAFPAELLIGKVPSLGDALAGLAIQAIWLVILLAVFRLAWAAAVKRYTAVSG
jgi:ABC-2 type transport system permease protein